MIIVLYVVNNQLSRNNKDTQLLFYFCKILNLCTEKRALATLSLRKKKILKVKGAASAYKDNKHFMNKKISNKANGKLVCFKKYIYRKLNEII